MELATEMGGVLVGCWEVTVILRWWGVREAMKVRAETERKRERRKGLRMRESFGMEMFISACVAIGCWTVVFEWL